MFKKADFKNFAILCGRFDESDTCRSTTLPTRKVYKTAGGKIRQMDERLCTKLKERKGWLQRLWH